MEILGEKAFRGETGGRILSGKGGKRRRSQGKGLRGERGKRISAGQGGGGGGKILGRKGRRSGAKRPNDLNKETGGKDLGEEREKI